MVYLIITGLLLLLAVFDLIVGVSNDAVNFLNSAIGSKAAPRRIILIVASLGILLGASFSSGMMEIARKGIFNPDFFFFSEVMILFLAVMITDIFLLDLFNTYGLPTSTTVSLIFELLGAAVAISLVKIAQAGESFSVIGNYINTSSAFVIVTSIFSSVVVAFLAGSIIQYFSRLLFSFHYQPRLKWLGGVWSGLALAFISYFLLFKGIKGASFVSADFINWVKDHTGQILLATFILGTILMQALIMLKVNVLRIVVLFGTFSLAMAFAGNDLVNFIGAPLAGLGSFLAWKGSGVAADAYVMSVLKEPVQSNTIFLLIAGAIMTATLWLSAKARSVTETEVSLARQDEGFETFEPNVFARLIVRFARNLNAGFQYLIPSSWKNFAEKSFQNGNMPASAPEKDRPAFDLIRASVNLTVASILIAFATSLKLPLSTTYVTFMVAMGTSLSDRAWGRGSAVYRVSGVLSVIGGWFFTAFVAFLIAGMVALFLLFLGKWAVGILIVLLALVVWKTHGVHKIRQKSLLDKKEFESQTDPIDTRQFVEEISRQNAQVVSRIAAIYQRTFKGLSDEDFKILKEARNELKKLRKESRESKNRIFRNVQRLDETQTATSRLYLVESHMESELVHSMSTLLKACTSHVENNLPPLSSSQIQALERGANQLLSYLEAAAFILEKQQFRDLKELHLKRDQLFDEWEKIMQFQIQGIKDRHFGMRNSMVFLTFQMETKSLGSVAYRMVKQYKRLEDQHEGKTPEEIPEIPDPF
ncbi:MAG: inorganic phosphate transporter [Lewinellaceae bacterium]|nr:inorganic phosphate transporter [Lewinellaceae bacterium]